MIRDEFLKRYIVFQYNKHIDKNIKTISFIIHKSLSRRFLKNENVLFIKDSRYGIIINRFKDRYTLYMDNNIFIENVIPEDLRRSEPINAEYIFRYLMLITISTPLNIRLLKPNVFDEIFRTSRYNTIKTTKTTTNFNRYKKEDFKEKIIKKIECNENFKESRNSEKLVQEHETFVLDFKKIKNSEDQTIPKLSQDKLRKLNINILSIVTSKENYLIENQDFFKTYKILKIFAFVKNFCGDKIPSDFSINKLVKSMKESAYNADVIGDLHEFLVDNLNEEIEKYGIVQLLGNLKSVIDSLPENDTIGDAKKKNDIGLKIWKVKTRAFLWDLQLRTDNKMIYSYYVMLSKKKTARITEAFNIRLELLEFLISCYFTTKIFRDVLLDELKALEDLEFKKFNLEKNIKMEEENMKVLKDDKLIFKIQVKLKKMNNELNEIKRAIVYNPTKSEIGTINQVKFMFIDNVIYASKRNRFYVLSRNTLENIAAFYIPTDKIENLALTSLKNVIEAIYN